jgi:rubredoxin
MRAQLPGQKKEISPLVVVLFSSIPPQICCPLCRHISADMLIPSPRAFPPPVLRSPSRSSSHTPLPWPRRAITSNNSRRGAASEFMSVEVGVWSCGVNQGPVDWGVPTPPPFRSTGQVCRAPTDPVHLHAWSISPHRLLWHVCGVCGYDVI